jgi:hypothetical protein
MDATQLPPDEMRACRHRDAAQPPSSMLGRPHDTCQRRADAARGHPYNEYLNDVNDIDKSACLKLLF